MKNKINITNVLKLCYEKCKKKKDLSPSGGKKSVYEGQSWSIKWKKILECYEYYVILIT